MGENDSWGQEKAPRLTKETPAEFSQRVLERTGVRLDRIPEITGSREEKERALLGSEILCDDSEGTRVVFIGPPDREEEDGTKTWEPSKLRKIKTD